MFERNRFAVATLRQIKDNIIINHKPSFNPIALIGLNRVKRYEIFYRIFDKEFNHHHRDKIMYANIDDIDNSKALEKQLIIIESIEQIINQDELQDKLLKLLSLDDNKQIILCSSIPIEEFDIQDKLRSRMMAGIQLYLQD